RASRARSVTPAQLAWFPRFAGVWDRNGPHTKAPTPGAPDLFSCNGALSSYSADSRSSRGSTTSTVKCISGSSFSVSSTSTTRRFGSSGPVWITLPGGQSGPAELAGAEHDAVGGHDLEVAPLRRSYGAGVRVAVRKSAPTDASRGLGVTTPVALRYPNGRVHETAVDFDLKVGDRSELYGHTWIAARWTVETKRRHPQI